MGVPSGGCTSVLDGLMMLGFIRLDWGVENWEDEPGRNLIRVLVAFSFIWIIYLIVLALFYFQEVLFILKEINVCLKV